MKKRRTVHMNASWVRMGVLWVFAVAVAYVFFTIAQDVSAQGGSLLTLKPGEKVSIECLGSKLSLLRLLRTRWRITCEGTAPVTPTPIPTVTPNATPTPTGSAVHTPTPTPTSGTLPPINTVWHSVGAHDGLNIHEHGDQPPAWADAFSRQNFNHGVVFGGDEATPNENLHKHQAYKGFFMNVSGVDVYIRYHAASNPFDRSVPLHSYEVYSRDGSGNVSFWQGWSFYGYPERRDQRMARHNEVAGYDPTNGIDWPGRGQFIIAGMDHVDWDRFLRCEQWYGHAGLWSWDVSITICGASTFYKVDEHLGDFTNYATWELSGSTGSSRRLEVSHYGPSNPNVGGLNLPFDRWFCAKKQPNENRTEGATPTWDITGAVSGPGACAAGYLPQYVSDSFPKAGVYFGTGNTAEKTFPSGGVTVPN